MMRRNRRGHGWSGSFSYLTKALKLDQAQLLEAVGEFGLRLAGGKEPVCADEGGFSYWLNQNSNGEIWINAEEKRGERAAAAASATPVAEPASIGADTPPAPATAPTTLESKGAESTSPGPSVQPSPAKTLPSENILTAVRILMQPKKRGEGVTASLSELAEKLEKSDEQLLAILGTAGLQLPETPKGKPTFAEHGGEIFWLNANAKGQVWINAKQAAARKSKTKKTAD
jgi:hypothetical protein